MKRDALHGQWRIPSSLWQLRWYAAGRQTKYPGLKLVESLMVDEFWERYRTAYTAAAYNVRVGRGRPVLEGVEEEFARDWQMSTQLRIDVLLWDGEELTVVEVKELADAEAFGQAYLYKRLLRRTYQTAVPIRSAVLCRDAHPDLVGEYVEHGISLLVVKGKLAEEGQWSR